MIRFIIALCVCVSFTSIPYTSCGQDVSLDAVETVEISWLDHAASGGDVGKDGPERAARQWIPLGEQQVGGGGGEQREHQRGDHELGEADTEAAHGHHLGIRRRIDDWI